MKQITATGPTVDEAVNSALKELNTTKEEIQIEVVDEGKKGIFGIFGAKPAIVKVTIVKNPIEEGKKFLQSIGEKMGTSVEIEVVSEGKFVEYRLNGDKIAMIIGKRGQTLNSIQYLTQLVVNRYSNQYINVVVDAQDYRKTREKILIQLAERLADKAVRTGQKVALEPMPSYERKIIHTALAQNNKVKTFSNGNDPLRHLVIVPNKQ